MATYEHVLAVTDLSPAANRAALQAARLARDLGAQLTLLHVVESSPMQGGLLTQGGEEGLLPQREEESEALARLCERAGRETGARPREVLAVGHPVDRILEISCEVGADLVVVAPDSDGAGYFLFGDVAQRVARDSGISVLVLR